tara:strand:- start:466 stop:1488 length:1023 start_codon:yes stop_codon:yes gene_type:complete
MRKKKNNMPRQRIKKINFLIIIILYSVFSPFKVFASSENSKVIITLKNGDIIRGILNKDKSSNNSTVIEHPQLGELKIGKTNIKTLKVDKTSQVSESINNTVGLKTNVDLSKWSGSISLGLDEDITSNDFSKSLDIDLSVDLTNKKDLITNTISFDWTHDASQYDIGGKYYDSHSFEIDQKTSKDINFSNLDLYFSNNYDYSSDSTYGMHSIISSIGISKDFLNSEDSSLSISLGPAVHFVYGGDECNIVISCGETYLAGALNINFLKKLSKKFELEINNSSSASYASTSIYGNELSTNLTFRPSDSSGFKTYFEYENDYKEFSNPKFNDKYSLNIGYDF